MKRIKQTYILLLAATLSLLTACYNDEPVNIDNPALQDGKVSIHLRVSQAAPTMTRAENGKWKDPNATDDEMMNVWTVVAVNKDNKVVAIYACKPNGEGQEEIDDLEDLPNGGTYRFYSFANMSPEKVMGLLNIQSPEILNSNSGEILASNFNTISDNTIVNIAFIDATVNADADENNIPVNVKGNGFNPETDDNGFGSKGIPMSNVQTITVSEQGQNINLIVVRMLAKIKLKITNESGKTISITSIKLTNITANANTVGTSGGNNLKLLPNLEKGHDTMESNAGYHGDIQPNLNGTPSQTDVEVLEPDNPVDIENNDSYEVTFYVNESDVRKPITESTAPNTTRAREITPDQKPSDNPNYNPDFYHFFLEIDINGEEKVRYTLIDDERNEDGTIKDEWAYIARNDYRIIPIVLDDYKLDLIPYDFPAIGVYPASVKEEDGIYTINFHDYGHFHLQPKVTKYSNGDIVPYGQPLTANDADKTYWTLAETWENSWGSWTDATKQTAPTNGFYREETTPATSDADEAGGKPVWYENTSSSPQWASDWAGPGKTIGYQPFIFGYIANPGNDLTGDKKVYHEFSIRLHKGTSDAAERVMTYRLYMILDTEQMLSSRRLGAPAARHTHGH